MCKYWKQFKETILAKRAALNKIKEPLVHSEPLAQDTKDINQTQQIHQFNRRQYLHDPIDDKSIGGQLARGTPF